MLSSPCVFMCLFLSSLVHMSFYVYCSIREKRFPFIAYLCILFHAFSLPSCYIGTGTLLVDQPGYNLDVNSFQPKVDMMRYFDHSPSVVCLTVRPSANVCFMSNTLFYSLHTSTKVFLIIHVCGTTRLNTKASEPFLAVDLNSTFGINIHQKQYMFLNSNSIVPRFQKSVEEIKYHSPVCLSVCLSQNLGHMLHFKIIFTYQNR